MDNERGDYVMPEAPSAEPSTPRSVRPHTSRPQPSPQSSTCPFLRDRALNPLPNPAIHSQPGMDVSPNRFSHYDPVHHPNNLSWSSNRGSPGWQYHPHMPFSPSYSHRPQMMDAQYYPGGIPGSFAPWPVPTSTFAPPPDPFTSNWGYHPNGYPGTQQGRQERPYDRPFESGHGLPASMSGILDHAPEQPQGQLEQPQQQEQPSQPVLGSAGFGRPMQNPAQVPTLPPPRNSNFMPGANGRSTFVPEFARLPVPEPRRNTAASRLSAPLLESDTRTNALAMAAQISQMRTQALTAELGQHRATPADSISTNHAQAGSASGSSSDNTAEDSDGESDDGQEAIQADEARILQQFHNGAAPYPVRMHDMTEERLRAHQLLRGAMSNKRIASKSALASLQSVDIESLAEKDRMCIICYNDFGVATPEGINEAPLRLPKCQHVFGDHCIKKWFEESDSCPYCRDKVESECQIRANRDAIDSFLQSTGRFVRGGPGPIPTIAQAAQSNMANMANLGHLSQRLLVTTAAAHRSPPRRSTGGTRQSQDNGPQSPGSPQSVQMPSTDSPRFHHGYRPPTDGNSPHRSPSRYPRRSGVNYRSHGTQASGGFPHLNPDIEVVPIDSPLQLPRLPGLAAPIRQPLGPTPGEPHSPQQVSHPSPMVAIPFGAPVTAGPPLPSYPQYAPYSQPMDLDRMIHQNAPIQNAWGPQGQ